MIGILLALAATLSAAPQEHANRTSEFIGSTPCDPAPRLFLGIPAAATCERITWTLAVAAHPAATFTLHAVYGMQARNQAGFEGGGSVAQLSGTWTTVTSPRDPAATVYRLTTANRKRSLELRTVGDNLLHLVDRGSALLVGNGGWSYTLNRKHVAARRNGEARFEPAARVPAGAAGVFDGRTPCQAVASQLGSRPDRDCTKLKWRLLLFQDPVTQAPTRYILEGTLYRNAPRRGTWTVVRGASAPALVVYRLDPDERGSFLSLLKADDNILLFLDKDDELLVGDGDFSYTLNRVVGRVSAAGKELRRKRPDRHHRTPPTNAPAPPPR